MKRACLGVWLLMLLWATSAFAQTRAVLDRTTISFGETVVLTIETDQGVQQIDYAPLQRQFEIGGQSVRRSYALVNGRASATTVFSIGLRPRGPGVLTLPALRVGNAVTAPLRLLVQPPSVQQASAHSDVFVETQVDASQPYVQQAVGVTVRLNYAVPLLSGQLDLDTPDTAGLQQVGEDATYERDIGGRRYHVVER
ncbi:MAG TPA: BatD family protein, partial [Thermomonas sp.]|nr:BatD family protein [Thermomonas sp.]